LYNYWVCVWKKRSVIKIRLEKKSATVGKKFPKYSPLPGKKVLYAQTGQNADHEMFHHQKATLSHRSISYILS